MAALPVPQLSRLARIESPYLSPHFDLSDPSVRPFTARRSEVDPATGQTKSASHHLPLTVTHMLRDLVGPEAATFRAREGTVSDAIARQHQADAVAVGSDVHFREGRLQPHDEAGIGLLAHEAVHVRESSQPNVSWRRSTQAGIAEEEQAAAHAEYLALLIARDGILPGAVGAPRPLAPSPATLSTMGLHPSATTAAVTNDGLHQAPTAPGVPESLQLTPGAAVRPMAAQVDRPRSESPPQAPMNLDAIRDQLFRDLMVRIKSDFERGA